MTDVDDPQALAIAIIQANEYMILATADESGRPWASPVWFATADTREFFWVSSPGTRHSRNLAVRAELAFSIFDSQQVPGTGRGVYASAVAVEVPEHEIDAGIAVFADASRRAGMERAWTRADVDGPARLRLYRASVGELFVLSSRDERIKVRI